MDKLSKAQQDEFATSYAILTLYDGEAEISSDQINALLEATGNTEVEAFYPIIFANFLSSPEKIAELISSPGAGGGGTLYILPVVSWRYFLGFFTNTSVSILSLQVVAAVLLLAETMQELLRKKSLRRRKRKLRWTLEAVWICSEETKPAVVTTKSSNKSRTCLMLQMATVYVGLFCLLPKLKDEYSRISIQMQWLKKQTSRGDC
jgi:hypothetical protein